MSDTPNNEGVGRGPAAGTRTHQPLVGPVNDNGRCAAECPFFRSRGERSAECDKLKAALDYYDGWLALCDDNGTPELIAENQAEYRRSNNKVSGPEPAAKGTP